MIQAMSGGLEKYPSAGSSLHAQYCASSKNRSVPFVYSAMTRTHKSAARPARSTENQLTSRLLVPGPGETDMRAHSASVLVAREARRNGRRVIY